MKTFERNHLEYVIECANSNSYYLNEKKNKRYKIFIYFLLICLFSKHKKNNFHNYFIQNGHCINKIQFSDFKILYYGMTFSNFKELQCQMTFVSLFSYFERIKLLLLAIITYKFKYCGFGKWIEVIFIDYFVRSFKIKILMSEGHYDRLTTEIAEICNYYHVEYWMKQHGLVSNSVKIPVKIFCSKCFVFDEDQKNVFKKTIISNDNCKYHISYKRNFDFTYVHTINNVGIIDAPFEYMESLISLVLKYFKNTNIYLMVHPLRNKGYYEKLTSNNKLLITDKKIHNLDCIISCASTLAYDYIRSGYEGKIIFIDIGASKKDMFYNRYSNLIYVNDFYENNKEIINLLTLYSKLNKTSK